MIHIYLDRKRDSMFQIERQEQILKYVNKKRKASVKELSDYLNVSKVTIRRDLDELVEKGLVIKIHGGVLSINNNLSYEIPFKKKLNVNVEEKRKIGTTAARFIEDGEVIILDAGSTTLEVARHLDRKNVTVITNDIKIAVEIAQKPNIKLIVTGGILERSVYTLIGPNAEDFLSKIHVNKTFLGADAISLEHGITNRTLQEVPIKRAMIKAADEVIVVADHSKLNKRVFASLCNLNEIKKLIIDKIDEDFKQALSEIGVEVILAD
jgi:DeoR/GlpR family transcriptional regulator of sugar metabolism